MKTLSKESWAFIGMQFGFGIGWAGARLADGNIYKASVAFVMAFIFAWAASLISRKML